MSKRSFAEVSFPISVSKSGNNSFTATAHNGCKSLFLSSVKKKNMKGCSLFNAKYYLCNRNSERSLVIQNNELSRISLISKSLPIQPVFNRRVLCFKHLAQYHIFLQEEKIFLCGRKFIFVRTQIIFHAEENLSKRGKLITNSRNYQRKGH